MIELLELGWRGHRHLLSMDQFSRKDVEDILFFSRKLAPYSGEGAVFSYLMGRWLKPLFFETSTRTLDRHTSAIQTMGGGYNTPLNPENSTMNDKQEKEMDIVIDAAQSSDILAIRHPKSGSVSEFAKVIDNLKNNKARIISCGDGPNEHPTQTLLDFYTVMEGLGTLDSLIWLIVGDLEYGRTVHSLVKGITKFSNNMVVGFPVGGLQLPQQYRPDGYKEFDLAMLPKIIGNVDFNSKIVLYATRVQAEKIARKRDRLYDAYDKEAKQKIQSDIYQEFRYQITPGILDVAPHQTKLLHPLPRGDEISDEIFLSHDTKISPIKQMRYGIQVTMAYLALFSGLEERLHEPEKYLIKQPVRFKS